MLLFDGWLNGCEKFVVEIVSDKKFILYRFCCVYYLFLNRVGGLILTDTVALPLGLVSQLGIKSLYF